LNFLSTEPVIPSIVAAHIASSALGFMLLLGWFTEFYSRLAVLFEAIFLQSFCFCAR
jgi:hypothetical protein